MKVSQRNLSMLWQDLDRAAFLAYFLGAIVPLVVLGGTIERYILRESSDELAAMTLMGLITFSALLSLGSFLMLRRLIYHSLKRMDERNFRLACLLNASRSLGGAHHGNDAGESAVNAALALTKASAACLFLPSKSDDSLEMSAASGLKEAGLYESLIAPLIPLADHVITEGHPAVQGREDGAGAQAHSPIEAAVVVPLPGEKAPLGALAVVHTNPGCSFDAHEVDALNTLAGLASVALINAELRFSQRNFFTHVTDILVTAVDVHLDYHAGHGRRVAQSANQVGRELGLDDKHLQRLHFAALLHDIGMLKIDRSIRHNTKSCAQHPVLGWRMLRGIRLWDEVASVVLHHHERFDGAGYPEGLAGEAIPLESRIIALCEAFDSMTAITSYKTPMPIDAALREIEANAGTQFDPVVARAFLHIMKDGAIGDDEFPSRDP